MGASIQRPAATATRSSSIRNPIVAQRTLSLSLKIFIGISVVVIVVLGATLAITARSARTAAEASVGRVAIAAREALNAQISGRSEALLKSAAAFTENGIFRDLVRQRVTADALDQSMVATETTGADWVQIVDADGNRLAKSDDPQAPNESLAGSPAIGGALEGNSIEAFGISADSLITQIAVVPIEDNGVVYGALMAVRYMGDDFAAAVKQAAVDQVDVVFYALDADDNPRVNGTTLARAALTPELVAEMHRVASSEGEDARADIEVGGKSYVSLGGLLRSAGGTPLGGFALLRDRDAEFALFKELERTIMYSGALGLLFAFLFSLLVAKWVTRPVTKLADAARRASDGDYAAEITANSKDEIGALAGAFRRLLSDLREKQALVEFLSSTDEAKTVQLSTAGITGTSAQRIAAVGLVPGSTFANRYEVKEILGQGGMGTVFKAVDRELGEVIAIKTLKQEFLREDPTALERFKSEIRLARKVSHRNIVRTHDLGERDGMYFITMEYVEGTSLKQLIRSRGRLPIGVALSVGKQLARALEVAHEQGIIHRDIKPQNMVVEPDGVLKVMDFGIARLATRPQESGMTQAGSIIGTPEYMAPEQVTGDAMDHRVDIYAAGAVLYECVTGRTPFTADTPYQLIAQLLEDNPSPPMAYNSEVPATLEALILKMLAKQAALRPQTALEVHDRLAEIG
jgi:HAMP domain-containing protein/predicted Ser/Thr protein kinase